MSAKEQKREPSRVVALSDGLFATVLTLLVLDLRLPDALSAQGGDLNVFISWLGPHLFSYLLTFLVAGLYWMAHHRDFENIEIIDRRLLAYNLLFLLFVGLFPFSTAAVSLGGFGVKVFAFYWAVYCANIILAGVMLTLTWLYAVHHRLMSSAITAAEIRHNVGRRIVTPAIFLLSAIMGYVLTNGFFAPYVLLLIPLGQWLVGRIYPEAESRHVPRTGWREVLWRAGSALPWIILIVFAAWLATR